MINCQRGQCLTICTKCYQLIEVKITVLTKENVLHEGFFSASLSCPIIGHNEDCTAT